MPKTTGRTSQLTLTINPELLETLKAAAKIKELPVAEVIERLLTTHPNWQQIESVIMMYITMQNDPAGYKDNFDV